MRRDDIKVALRQRGFTIADFGRAIGRTRTVASRILNGDVKLQLSHVDPLAKLLGVAEQDVLRIFGLTLPGSGLKTLPVVGEFQVGQMSDKLPSEGDEFIVVPNASQSAFALRVEGTSMDRIAPPGALVVVDPDQKRLAFGDLGVFRRAGQATFKRLESIGGVRYLTPESFDPTHAAIPLEGGEPFEIVGRVTCVLGIASRARPI